jgi:hypothetical protein
LIKGSLHKRPCSQKVLPQSVKRHQPQRRHGEIQYTQKLMILKAKLGSQLYNRIRGEGGVYLAHHSIYSDVFDNLDPVKAVVVSNCDLSFNLCIKYINQLLG